jgi:hypothetical protein
MSGFLSSAGQMLAAQQVRKFRLAWSWRTHGRLTFFKTIWHGKDGADAVRRFTAATPQALSVRVIEEVRP